MKPNHVEAAKEMFEGAGMVISTEGERYLDGAVGSSSFIHQYVKRKVECCVSELEKLSAIVETQPHAAYAAYTHGLSSKWNYLLRVTDWEENQIEDVLVPLEKVIRSCFIPALTGQPPPGEHTREMLALPARLGGLGLVNPTASANEQQAASQQISAPLVDQIYNQNHHLDNCHSIQQSIKRRIQHVKHAKQKEHAKNIQHYLPAAPKPFSIEHALTCKTGGFPAVRHNKVRDITATMLTEVCHGVTTEQPLSRESLTHRSANTEDGARLDIAMYGFWGGRFEKHLLT